jgi:hypothetical protein
MKKITSILLGGGLAVALTVAAGAPAAQARRTAPPPKPTITTSTASPVVGKAFRVTGRAPGTRPARIVLQRKVAAHGRWTAVASRQLTRSTRKATWTRREAVARRVWYRTKLGARYSVAKRITVRRPPAPPTTFIMSAGRTDGGDIFVGEVYSVGGELTKGGAGVAGVSFAVARRLGISGPWQSLGSYTTDGTGAFSLTDSSSDRGMVYYRATGGGRTGMTAMPVFDVISMPAVTGPTLKMSYKPTTCNATLAGDDSALTIGLREKAGCTTKAGDYVDLRWNPPGICAPVRLDDFSLTGESSPGAEEVRVQIYLDGNPIYPEQWRRVQRGSSTGSFSTGSNEFDELGIRMTVSEGSGDFVGQIANAEAQCL